MRSITERPGERIGAERVDDRGLRIRRCWLFATISTTLRNGCAARNATGAVRGRGFSAIFSSRDSLAANVRARWSSRAGWPGREHRLDHVSGRSSRLSRAVDFTSASSSCISANSTVASSVG
jgi:hypothetical protein